MYQVQKYGLYLFVLLFIMPFLQLNSQIVYTHGFTELLKEAHLDYYKPLEEWYHVSPKKRDKYMKYDLVLLNESTDREVRYYIKTYQDDVLDQIPHVSMMRLIQHIATNDENAEIRAVILDQDLLENRFNADWGICQYFIPKKSYSDLPFGALISIYAKGKSTAYAVILYSDIEFEPLKNFYQLRFRE